MRNRTFWLVGGVLGRGVSGLEGPGGGGGLGGLACRLLLVRVWIFAGSSVCVSSGSESGLGAGSAALLS